MNLPKDADGQVSRVAGRFALVAAGGELATSFGITGWPSGTAFKATSACFNDWLRNRGTVGKAEIQKAENAIRAFLLAHGASRFQSMSADIVIAEKTVVNRAGWFSDTNGERQYHFSREAWQEAIKSTGCDWKFLAQHLSKNGHVILDKDRNDRQIRIPGGKARVISVKHSFLSSDSGSVSSPGLE